MIKKALLLKIIITLAVVLYFIHPILPTIGSLIWLWSEL